MIFRFFIWTGFLAILLLFIYNGRFFSQAEASGIVHFELATVTNGKLILTSWEKAGLLPIALRIIWFDFAYIFFYVAILITLSNLQIRKESSVAFNALLRSNFFFAFIAGLLDIFENIFMLYNIYSWSDREYISSRWIASLKFILIAWVVLVWLISFIKSKIK